MSTSFIPFAVAALLVVGCVTVAPSQTAAPTAPASAVPGLGVATPVTVTPAPVTPAPVETPAASPTSVPIQTPPLSSTLEPTSEPTGSPEATADPSADPSAEPSGNPDVIARDVVFTDDLSDPASGWDTLDESVASILYGVGGALEFRFNQSGYAYTVRTLDEAQTVVRPVAVFAPDGPGVFGLLCGNTNNTFYAAIVTTDGDIFVSIINNELEVLDRNNRAGLDIPADGTTVMGLQCTLREDGQLHMVLGIQGSGPVAVFSVDNAAMPTLDVVGLYGEAVADEWALDVDNVATFGVGGPTATLSTEAEALLTHIPQEFLIDCWESPTPPLFAEPATAVVTCIQQTSGDAAEIAEYAQFATKSDMDMAYQERKDAFGVEPQGSCSTGPNEAPWNFGEGDLGRVQCAPQEIGIRFDWTDDRLNVLSSLVDFEGSYELTYEQWTNAALTE